VSATAATAAPGPAVGNTRPIVIFELSGCRFGLALDTVEEIVPAVAITGLPRAPAIIEGVVDVRGAVLPVFDLRRRFGWPPKPLDAADHLVVAHAGSRRVLLRTDQVAAIADLAIDAAAEIAAAVPGVAGIARLADGMVLIHDLAAFLSTDEAAALDRAMA
jgi:purine-binding chemotaxis protein CheW